MEPGNNNNCHTIVNTEIYLAWYIGLQRQFLWAPRSRPPEGPGEEDQCGPRLFLHQQSILADSVEVAGSF